VQDLVQRDRYFSVVRELCQLFGVEPDSISYSNPSDPRFARLGGKLACTSYDADLLVGNQLAEEFAPAR
jgi:hypothetical protein